MQNTLLHFCFDLDLTLTLEHLFPLRELQKNDMRYPDELRDFLSQALADGHKISITTHRARDEEWYAKSALCAIGLTAEEVAQIVISADMHQKEQGKLYHIGDAERKHGISRNEYAPILVEDSNDSIDHAKDAGILTLKVDADFGEVNDKHIKALRVVLRNPQSANAILQQHERDQTPRIDTSRGLPPLNR